MTAPPTASPQFRLVPAVFFGMVLGIGGLGSAWRSAARVWGYPVWIGEVLCILAVAVWALWLVLFARKWIGARAAALAEVREPAMAFSVGLVPMATMLASVCLAPYAPVLGWWIYVAGAAAGLAYAAWVSSAAWQGGRTLEAVTPLVYLSPVGAGFLGALGAGVYGLPDLAVPMWGAAAIAWVVWESVVLHRLLTSTLPVNLRATVGIQVAPPAVGCMAYLAFTPGPPDRLAQMLLGYALLQGLITLGAARWLREQPFGPGVWGYTFGVAALAVSALWFVERGGNGFVTWLAWPLLMLASGLIGWIAVRTVQLVLSGRLFPRG